MRPILPNSAHGYFLNVCTRQPVVVVGDGVVCVLIVGLLFLRLLRLFWRGVFFAVPRCVLFLISFSSM